MDESTLALLIPIISVVMGCSIPILIFLFKYLKEKALCQALHRERLMALEKGMDVPPWPERFLDGPGPSTPRHPRVHLRHGLFWMFTGLGLGLALFLNSREGATRHWYALIPCAVGAAYLLYYAIEGRRETLDWEKDEARRQSKAVPGGSEPACG